MGKLPLARATFPGRSGTSLAVGMIAQGRALPLRIGGRFPKGFDFQVASAKASKSAEYQVFAAT